MKADAYSIKQKIENHQMLIEILKGEMFRNSGKSITKGNSINGEINYHLRQIEKLQKLLDQGIQ